MGCGMGGSVIARSIVPATGLPELRMNHCMRDTHIRVRFVTHGFPFSLHHVLYLLPCYGVNECLRPGVASPALNNPGHSPGRPCLDCHRLVAWPRWLENLQLYSVISLVRVLLDRSTTQQLQPGCATRIIDRAYWCVLPTREYYYRCYGVCAWTCISR